MRRSTLTAALALLAAVPGAAVAQTQAATPVASAQALIEAAMRDSAAGWNAGNFDRFLAIYAGDATYVSGSAVRRGKAEIAARYRPSFVAGGNVRGQLAFEPLAFRPLSAVHAILTARWRLTPANGEGQSGLTTLVFERRREGWRIIADHSS